MPAMRPGKRWSNSFCLTECLLVGDLAYHFSQQVQSCSLLQNAGDAKKQRFWIVLVFVMTALAPELAGV